MRSKHQTTRRYLDERIVGILKAELSRGEGAERKAIHLLTITAAGAGIVTALIVAMFDRTGSNDTTILVFVTAVVLQLTKSAFYSLKAIRPGKVFMEDPNALTQERKTQDYATALEADIDLRLWLYSKAVRVHSTKLFYVDRAVRNLGGAVLVALLGAVLSIWSMHFASVGTPARHYLDHAATAISIIALLFALGSDRLVEGIDDTWTFPGFHGLKLKD